MVIHVVISAAVHFSSFHGPVPWHSFASQSGLSHQDHRTRISLENTHPFLDEILLQSLTREAVAMGFVVKRKRGFCGLHSTAFISPIVVLGIGWLMRVSWG